MTATGPDDAAPYDQDGLARLTTEIRLLVEMLVEQAVPWLDELFAAGHGSSPGREQSSDDESDDAAAGPWQWCPPCAFVALGNGERPEFVVRVFEQAAQLVALLRAVLADRWEPESGVHMPGEPATRDTSTTSPRVQHITVHRRDDTQRNGPTAQD